MGSDFRLGEAASCLTRLLLPNPSITDLDQAVEQAVDHLSLADLRALVKSLDHARFTVQPHGGAIGAVAHAADGEAWCHGGSTTRGDSLELLPPPS